ncbi:MAG: hypothetical protein GF350_13460 [Chitinivibrionales bacterium]|nr:hypothetical protein [Chitinivibrionales bacterium]
MNSPHALFYLKCLLCVALPIGAYASPGALPGSYDTDARGWSLIAPSADSRIMYVGNDGDDSSGVVYSTAQVGNDPKNPTITPQAFKTPGAAFDLMRENAADWVLFQRGDAWQMGNRWLSSSLKSGRSASERNVVACYGETGARPQFKTDADDQAWNSGWIQNVAVIGIHLYSHERDPSNADFTGWSTEGNTGVRIVGYEARNILFEDVRIGFYKYNLTWQGYQGRIENLEMRRCIVHNAWTSGSTGGGLSTKSQGIFAGTITNYNFEENIFYHNGWNDGSSTTKANMYNHNWYIAGSNDGERRFVGNISLYGAAHGAQFGSGGYIANNVFSHNAIGFNLGRGDKVDAFDYPPGHKLLNNAVLSGRLMDNVECDNSHPRTTAVWAVSHGGDKIQPGTDIIDNIIANVAANCSRANFGGLDKTADFPISLSGNCEYQWPDHPKQADWPDPDRTIETYHGSIGKQQFMKAFADAAINRTVGTMPCEYTACAVLNYVREGFGKSAIPFPYEYNGTCGGATGTFSNKKIPGRQTRVYTVAGTVTGGHDFVELKMRNVPVSPVSITIFTLNGAAVYSGLVVPAGRTVRVNTADLPAGIFRVELRNRGSVIRHIMVNNL